MAPRRVRRIDLVDLDRAAVDTLLHLVLRAPVEASTITEIWSASQGNVLFVRELVLGALDAGQLVEQHGVWRLTGGLVATQRLHELVAARLSGLDAASEALDVLAVWEPIGVAALEEMTGSEQLELLDRAGLLSIRVDGRRQRVSLAHPLYGEVLRARMPALTRRRLLIELADRLERIGGRRREDATRIAAARLQALRLGRSRAAPQGRSAGALRARLPPGRAVRPRRRDAFHDRRVGLAARRGAARGRLVRRSR